MDPLLNIPVGLSLVDDFVLKHLPKGAKSGMIINAGTGRLSKAIKQELGASVTVYNIEPREQLYNLLDNDEFKSKDPWDLEWYNQIAKKHQGLDFIFFLNIHEYWDGNVLALQTILQLLKPEGVGFISFYNKNSLYEIRQNIPPFVIGVEQLTLPMNHWAKMDLGSWMIYLTDIGFPLTHVWGMLEDKAFKYCNETTTESTIWKAKNLEIKIQDVSDAYVLGAPVMCMRFQGSETTTLTIPQFVGVQYNASLFQAILFPYLDVLSNELDVFNAHLEVNNHLQEEEKSLILLSFFIDQLEGFENVKKVLVIGCNWGIDLLTLKKIKPNWDITGVDGSKEIIAAGAELMKKEGVKTLAYGSDGSLPFKDNEFDLVISLNHFSNIHQPLAERLAKEMLRVSKQGIAQIEDFRGPKLSIQLKLYSIPDIYASLGQKAEVRSIKIEGKHSGLYILVVKKQSTD